MPRYLMVSSTWKAQLKQNNTMPMYILSGYLQLIDNMFEVRFMISLQGPLLLTWFNFNPCMDK